MLGKGAFGVVWLASKKNTTDLIALKIIKKDLVFE